MTSRYSIEDTLTKIGFLIIDSSASTSEDSPTSAFLDNSPPKFTKYIKPSHWEVRSNLYESSGGKTFPVYVGDGKYPPQILPEDYKLGFDMDPDLLIFPPFQLYGEFQADITRALQDKGGISTASNDSFFGGNVSHIVNCSKIKNRIPEVIKVDFYDKTDRLIDKIEPMINLIPRNTAVWIGLDLAIKNDVCGISMVSFDHWEYVGDTKLPKMRCHFILGVSRKEGQQTSLFHVFDLIVALSKRFRAVVSADMAHSSQLLQDCEREGIATNGRISTDNSPCEPALYLKNILNQELIELPEHKRFLREAYDLKYVTNKVSGKIKIDHPKKATQDPKIFDLNDGVGSKDCWDSLASAVYSLKMSIDKNEEHGFNSETALQLEVLKDMTKDSREEAAEKFQSMLEGLF